MHIGNEGHISNQPVTNQTTTSVIKYKDDGNKPPSPPLERQILRALATILSPKASIGILAGRKLLQVITGAVITSSLIGALGSKERASDLEEFESKNHQNAVSKLRVTTSDGAKLDGRVIEPKATPVGDKKYVIWLNGLGESYESKLNNAVEYADHSGAGLLVFNYRGAGDSKGLSTSGQDYVTDTLAMVNYLKSTGIKEENITIHGYSMGGGIGADAAAQLEKVKFINDRSFTSLSAAAKETVAKETECKIGNGAAKALGSFVGSLVELADFDLSTKKIYEQSDSNNVNSLQSRTLIVAHKEDNIVNKSALAKDHSITQSASLSGRIVELSIADDETLHDNEAKLTNIGNGLKGFGIVTRDQYRAHYDELGKAHLATDQQYTEFLTDVVQEKLKTCKPEEKAYLNRVLTELKGMTFSGDHVHGKFVLDFPAASRIIDFIQEGPRFAEATPNSPSKMILLGD